MTKFRMNRGARKIQNQPYSPLHVAARRNWTGKILRLVKNHGHDIDAADAQRNTPLHLAVIYRTNQALGQLLGLGAHIHARNSAGCTPLHLAVIHQSLEAMIQLVKLRIDINTVDLEQQTPLHLAASYRFLEGIKVLVGKKPNSTN